MEWQKNVVCADSMQVLNGDGEGKGEGRKRRETDIWEDPDFLEKLNDFIMDKSTFSNCLI